MTSQPNVANLKVWVPIFLAKASKAKVDFIRDQALNNAARAMVIAYSEAKNA